MKKIILLFFAIIISTTVTLSQCRNFTVEKIIPNLDDFLLTGKYHSMMLGEGEEILIFKTINKSLTYRIVVMGDQNIPQPNFALIDWDNKLIFDNKDNNNTTTFDYKCNKTQRIKIIIKVPKTTDMTKMGEGCVGLVIGIKTS